MKYPADTKLNIHNTEPANESKINLQKSRFIIPATTGAKVRMIGKK
jgi:hypothetical protein